MNLSVNTQSCKLDVDLSVVEMANINAKGIIGSYITTKSRPDLQLYTCKQFLHLLTTL